MRNYLNIDKSELNEARVINLDNVVEIMCWSNCCIIKVKYVSGDEIKINFKDKHACIEGYNNILNEIRG